MSSMTKIIMVSKILNPLHWYVQLGCLMLFYWHSTLLLIIVNFISFGFLYGQINWVIRFFEVIYNQVNLYGYRGKHICKGNIIARINVDWGLTPSAISLCLPLVLPFELIALSSTKELLRSPWAMTEIENHHIQAQLLVIQHKSPKTSYNLETILLKLIWHPDQL